MINTVRNTVLSVLNKNNYGYLSPADFNLFAKQAQLDIFESYFYQYNYQINKENARQSGTGIADLAKGIEESMDLFSVTKGLNLDSTAAGQYLMPSEVTTGSDYYLVNKVLVYKTTITSGITTDNPNPNELVDANVGVDFNADGIVAGDIVAVETATQGVQYVTVVSVDSGTQITVTGTVLTAANFPYTIITANTQQNEAEKVTHSKITMLNNSIYTAPTFEYPAYTSEEVSMQVFPQTSMTAGRVIAQYFRYPKDPNWTYVTLTGGEPVFNQSDPDYQDFEIPLDDQDNLIMKILQYAGVTIREPEVYQFATGEETKENQKES
tara:strand:- start:1306 stop:2277 length:972 start_codon:yes stop_codon:yes gene_type:complete